MSIAPKNASNRREPSISGLVASGGRSVVVTLTLL